MTRDLGHTEIAEVPRRDPLSAIGALWVVTPLLAVAGYLWLVVQSFNTVGCEGDCREGYLYWPMEAYPWVVVGAMAVAVVAAFALRASRHRTEWAALGAFVLVLAAIVAASAIRDYGFAPMHERNDRIARGEANPSSNLPTAPPSPVGSWGDSRPGAPRLDLAADGTLTGYDGCNEFSGEWMLDADGVAMFRDLAASVEVCDGVDTWLSYGRSAHVVGVDLWIGDESRGTIGFLPPGSP